MPTRPAATATPPATRPIFPLDTGDDGAPPCWAAFVDAAAIMDDAFACSDVMTDVADDVILLTTELREEATSADS
ncbi:MAG: hypothetical protein L6R42_009287, partial [Xanthoria sp. 1 TBL-2021]